eukprot:CAMPEP_0171462364 /NCGR_PEP_ID=MMETSP0945-20130129/6429_1 /TAXON_ID=109269 /ORGANISM="Vaucheria litorea, Strain CCMP2940" /LENGTH=238 /DNA_ID=CAMNT_0011988871 /DNA_START=19 /DNA_END=735 /DNA_ORIENTATION=-
MNDPSSNRDEKAEEKILNDYEMGEPMIRNLRFYQKSNLTEDGNRDDISKVPIQLSRERSDFWYVGMPEDFTRASDINAASYDTTKSYVILSLPENHSLDELERKWLQSLFCLISTCNLVVLLYYVTFVRTSNFPTRVEPIVTAGVPGPFNKLPSNEMNVLIHCTVAFCIGIFGITGVLCKQKFLLVCFKYLVILNFMIGAPFIPFPFLLFRYFIDFCLVFVASSLKKKLSLQWERTRV